MTRLLLDANLSPRTARFLEDRFGFDVVSLLETDQARVADIEVVRLAQRDHRVVITCDVGFGRLYFRYERGGVGIIVLRLVDQSVDSTNSALQRFFSDPVIGTLDLERSLVVIDETKFRVSTDS